MRTLVLVSAVLLGCQSPPDTPTSATPAPSTPEAPPAPREPAPRETNEPSAPPSDAATTEASAATDTPQSCVERVGAFRKRLAATAKGDTVTPDPGAPGWIQQLHREIEEAADPSHRATLLAEGMKKAIAGCAPVAKAFGRAASLGVDEKEAVLRGSLPAALEECECEGVDVGAFGYLIRYAMAAP